MPRKAFLKNKSLLDRFKDNYATHTGYIQSARAEHTWNNPLTRRKRTKELNRWIKSFAGKDHIHKLARFNATNAGRYESMYNEAMSLKGFLENLTEKLTKQFNLDAEKVQAYLDSHTQEMQELLDDKDLSLKEKVLFVRSEITGEKDEKKSESISVQSLIIPTNDDTWADVPDDYYPEQVACDICDGKYDDVVMHVVNSNILHKSFVVCDDCVSVAKEILEKEEHKLNKGRGYESKKSEKLVISNPCVVYKGDAENAAKAHDYLYKKMPRVKGASISSDVKPLGNNKFCRVLFYGNNTGVMNLFGYYSNLYNDDFWNNCDADPQGWVNPQTIARYDVATPRQESKESTDEKLGYEKGHKNSRGENAPWVIRSHEDNRILASFANKKDAEEHMKRMKQYSKSESKQNEGLSNEKVKDAVKFAATEAGLENYLDVDSDGAMSVTVSLPINSDDLKTVRWVIDSNDGTITEYLDTEKNLTRDFTDDESLVSMLTLLFQTSRMELRDWLPKKSESVNMDGFKNMLRTYNEKGDSVKNGPWRICDGANDLWFELYYNETPILGCTDNICKWYSNPETVGMTLDDYKEIEDAISSEIFAIDSFKMPESKKSESLADNPSDIHTQLSNLIKQDKIITFLNDVDGPVIYMDASKGSIPYGDYLLKYLGIDPSAMMVSSATVYNVEDIESYDILNGLSSSFVDSQKNKGINKVCKITTKYLTKPKKSEDADDNEANKLYIIQGTDSFTNFTDDYTQEELHRLKTSKWTDADYKKMVGLLFSQDHTISDDEQETLYSDIDRSTEIGTKEELLAMNYPEDLFESKKSEDANDVTYELTEDAVTDLIKELGLEIVNTWYDGNKDRIVYDCKDKGDENGETVCVWVEPPYEARVWLKDVNPRVNQLVEGIETLDALKAALVDIFKIELGESHVTESLHKPENTIIVPNWLWETYTLGENYDGDTLTDDEQQTYLDFKEKYEGFSLKAVSENTTFRSDNDFDSNGCPCYEVNVFKK